MSFPYAFPGNAAQEVYLEHVSEHFEFPDIARILREVYRILRLDGIADARVPHVFSVGAWSDPTLRMAFTFGSVEFWTVGAAKAYYKEAENLWELTGTAARVTRFNWKRFRMRRFDGLLSRLLADWFNWLLRRPNLPGSAGPLVKAIPMFFVELGSCAGPF